MRRDVCDTLPKQQLLVFEAFDLALESAHDSRNGRLDDPLDILLDLLFDVHERRAQRLGFDLDVRLFAFPNILEHRARELDDLRARLGGAEHRLELALDDIAADRFAVALAAFARTLVVGVSLALLTTTRRPARGQRAVAVIAQNRAAQREGLREIGPVGGAQPIQTILNPLMRLQGDERLVMALAACDTPLRSLNVTRIDRVAEHVANALMRKLAAFGLWIKRMFFEKALHIGLTAEASRGIAFQRLDDDGGFRFLPNQHLAIQSSHAAIPIPARSGEHGEAVLKPSLHAVPRLLGIVDAVIVRESDRHVFHEARG